MYDIKGSQVVVGSKVTSKLSHSGSDQGVVIGFCPRRYLFLVYFPDVTVGHSGDSQLEVFGQDFKNIVYDYKVLNGIRFNKFLWVRGTRLTWVGTVFDDTDGHKAFMESLVDMIKSGD